MAEFPGRIFGNKHSMRYFTAKQIFFLLASAAVFTLAVFFVYSRHLYAEMFAEAGIVAGNIVAQEEKYFNGYGEFAALERRSFSQALGIDLRDNKYFTAMRIETFGNEMILHAYIEKGFFKATELIVKYGIFTGVSEYEIKEKTKIPLPRL